jgi:cytosine/adenosine deaminase-related metal-dependent hydrolase
MATTLIKNAELAVAWDASESRHAYLPDADVAFEDGTIRFVGRHYEGAADTTVDGAGLMVMPGLVNIHSHPSSEPMNKGLLDEIGSPGLYNSSLYEFMPIFRSDAEAVPDCVRVALSELLLSGVTTLADLSIAHPGWLDLLAEAGMRVCIAPMFRSARWFTKNGHVVEYEWDEAAGEKAMEEAFTLISAPSSTPPAACSAWPARRRSTPAPGLPARQPHRGAGARHLLADPRRAVGGGVPRDHPPARLHAHPVAARDGPAG